MPSDLPRPAACFSAYACEILQFTQVHEVQARSSAPTGTTGSNGSLANADAFIAMGSVAVEEVRMIKSNDGTTLDL